MSSRYASRDAGKHCTTGNGLVVLFPWAFYLPYSRRTAFRGTQAASCARARLAAQCCGSVIDSIGE